MNKEKQLQDFLLKGDKTYVPRVSVDCVIFGFHEDQLKVLLLRWRDGRWCLPGGFVKWDESVDDSAVRTLQERTALRNIYLQQFHTFGDPGRERGKRLGLAATQKSWMRERFISVGYYALVEFSKVAPKPDWLSDECRWWDIHEVPSLIYDHNQMVEKALDKLRLSLNDYPAGYNLLPEKFTMPELQRLYETILDKPLDRRNFQKKMLSLGILERLKERKTGGAHKAPYLYRFDKKKYEKAMKQGLKFGF
ncbi:MAG TPA: NUDIX domain-containing protein [Ohtaekwangia sp.]|uniref:NUDIX hydrolase n=1 Tax=Ohtaekwangia sp. TaxID=2066019 RepID=UPI002F940AF5